MVNPLMSFVCHISSLLSILLLLFRTTLPPANNIRNTLFGRYTHRHRPSTSAHLPADPTYQSYSSLSKDSLPE